MFLKFFVHFYTWSDEDKTKLRSLIETTIEYDKSDVEFGSLKVFWSLKVFQVWWYLLSLMRFSEYDDLHIVRWCQSFAEVSFLIQDVDFWLTFLPIFYRGLLSLFCASDALIHVNYLVEYIIWSCTLEQILVYPIVLQYFVIFKTFEELYKRLLFQKSSPFWWWQK